MFGIVNQGDSPERCLRVAQVVAVDGSRYLSWPGGSACIPAPTLKRPRQARAARGAQAIETRPEVLAPCAGGVTKRDVESGEQVEAGQRIGVLEAMKMEFALIAAIAGVVHWLPEGDGRVVQKGASVARVAPAA